MCDIGCGTGTSSFVLEKLVGPDGQVLGVDFSSEMLNIAMEKAVESKCSNIKFIQCDASELDSTVDSLLDSILYNACIFLIPEPGVTLKCSYDLLKAGGMVGMNYLIGMSNGNVEERSSTTNLFDLAKANGKAFAPYGRAINDVKSLHQVLKEIGFQNVLEGTLSKELSLAGFKAFYSIPAQSAALWPKNSYEERLELLDKLIEFFHEKEINRYYQYWGWCVGEK